MPRADPVAVVRGVSRRLGGRWVLRDVTVEVRPGDAVLVLGRNGAGKTTLLRVAAGLLRPSKGTVISPRRAGYVAHDTMLYDALTARENLRFFARLHGLHTHALVDRLLEQFGLIDRAAHRAQTLSRGMLQRLAIARALLHDPDLLLLDEPLSNLDDAGSQLLIDVLRERLARGCATVIATHQISELIGCATRAGFLVAGRLTLEAVTSRDPAALVTRYREVVRGT